MRVDCKKFLFYGARSAVEAFFDDAQNQGIVEFIDPKKTKIKEVPRDINRIQQAIRVLHGLPTTEQLEVDDYENADELAREITGMHDKIEVLLEERREIRQEIARIEVFGDFSLSDIAYIEREGNRKVQFYCAKHHTDIVVGEEADIIHVGSDHGLDYFVAFNAERRSYQGMLEMIIDKPLGELHTRLADVDREVHELELDIKKYANRQQYLHEALVDRMNHYSLQSAKKTVKAAVDDSVFFVEGWVADYQLKALDYLVKRHPVHCEEVQIEAKDRVPTCLHNEGYARIGEDLVHIYDTPSVGDKDPSPWVLVAFALFFSMILSDGGYGAIFLIAALFLRYKFPKAEGGQKRFITLATILGTSCLLWGIFSNSFFGLSIAPDNPIMKFSVVQRLVETKAAYHLEMRDDTWAFWVKDYPNLAEVGNYQDFLDGAVNEIGGSQVFAMRDKFYDNIMMELALLVGVIHIALSFLRSLDQHWAGIGWVAALIGGYLYFGAYLKATSMANFVVGMSPELCESAGMELLAGGIGVACVLSIFQHRLMGVTEILNVIQVFSDVLSYLRLYALGLAGSMVSSTFNGMGASVTVVAGALIILFGHVVNIALSIMGGVIHGLRLNFLEWYHYCFEGGGYLFKPLRKLKIK